VSSASPRHIKTSADGSLTLWVPKLDEYYHSIHGALTESQHVFINAGLKSLALPEVRVLEVGLGTALNARLTLEQKGSTLIHYTALEKFPLSTEEIDLIARSNMQQEGLILRCEPFVPTELIPGFHFELITTDLRLFDSEESSFDLIYFDAFAPSAQPELWTDEVFEKMFKILAKGGCLVTYCAKGVVKRSMKAAGFEVERLPGPPRKREMTRAWKR
jgi:tRNA U34 5-methylaminomethyl-2-thiouridine-forming methyltransferase MnmC|tara:strand:- start:7756 stop:8406 length:651 start_codon:yes stop_codon:yes gene_type:complete